MSNENVVEFHPREPTDDDRMLHTRGHQRWCLCRRFELDLGTQRVFCKDCGREVPAFEALADVARRHEALIWERKRCESEAKRVAELLATVRRLEHNAKARLRNAVGRAPACTCDDALRKQITQVLGRWRQWAWCPMCGGRR